MALLVEPDQSAKNLSLLALFISNDVSNMLMASLVTTTIGGFFSQYEKEEQKRLFRTNPANTLVYTSLRALEERSIVRISETLKDEHKLHPISVVLRRKEDLDLHRDAISHPMTVKWRSKKMQEFAEADRGGYDWRPAQVWDLQRSINEELKANGLETHNESIPLTWDMVDMIRLALDLSRQPSLGIPPREALLDHLRGEAVKYKAMLEKHPDGMRDLDREKKRAERREAQRREWAAAKSSGESKSTKSTG